MIKNKTILALIFGMIITLITVNKIISTLDEDKEYKFNYENEVGKKILLNNDTLIITHFSANQHIYNLSNRVVIDCKLAKNLIIK